MATDSVKEREREPAVWLWVGLTVAPAAWFLQLAVGYALVPMVCSHGSAWSMHLVSAVALLAALSGVWAGWRSVRHTAPSGGEESAARGARFLAIAGLLLSAYFALIIAMAWLPSFLVESCAAH